MVIGYCSYIRFVFFHERVLRGIVCLELRLVVEKKLIIFSHRCSEMISSNSRSCFHSLMTFSRGHPHVMRVP